MKHLVPFLIPVLMATTGAPSRAQDDLSILDFVEHHEAVNGDVKLHYAQMGEGPLVVMLHGFPDYWYTWRHQMAGLSEHYTVVAMDLRGYNLSDAPAGVENYAMPLLVSDVAAVIEAAGEERAIVVGHDWGAAIAWQFAMNRPDMIERLIILSVPHPSGFGRELASNKEQQADSQYARDFQKADSHESLTAQGLAGWVQDPQAYPHYVEAFQRSSFDGMMNYYRANYPSSSSSGSVIAQPQAAAASWPKIKVPVLVIHGRQDRALNARGHNSTWEWVDNDVTILMIRDANHFVQHDASERVTRTMRDWLLGTEGGQR